MPRTQVTPAERDQRRAADRQRMQQAVNQLLDSDGWKRWVTVRAKNGLARYSLNNQLLIALQRPDATYVAGFKAFLQLNRCVRKGERAIRILAPISIRRHDSTAANDADPAADERRTVFRSVAVFDVSQTEPLPGTDPAPLQPPVEPVTGDSHRHLLSPLERLAAELGYTVSHKPIPNSADGYCDHSHKLIAVETALTPNGKVRVLIHELAHALGIGYHKHGRRRAEVLVDTATYIVCSSAGLDVSGSSVPYVTAWGEHQAEDAIRDYASVIDSTAKRIEAALQPVPEP